MIALRGVVYQDAATPDKWKWSGLWTFGSLPPHIGRDLESLNVKIPNVRPFHYTWEKAESASEMEIPSLVTYVPDDDDDNHDVQNNETTKEASTLESNETAETPVGGDSKSSPVESTTKDEMQIDVAKPTTPVESSKKDDKMEIEKMEVDKIEDKKHEANSCETPANDNKMNEKANNSPDVSKQDKDAKAIMFSTMLPGEPAYTEAASLLACPPDGGWNGFFENIVRGRKADNRVPESVSLFWNATPPKDARCIFFEDDEADKGLLPPGKVHVRGMGTNLFGIFELLGSFDQETKVLELQRMYVSTPEPAAKPSPKKATPTAARKSTASRSYSTRKRRLSWQKRSTLSDDEDEIKIVGVKRHVGSSKKRPRSSSTVSAIGEKGPPPSATNHSKPTPISVVSAVGGATKRPSPTASAIIVPGPKKRGGSQANKSAVNASSPPSSPNAVKLPSVGDPDEARWRAAHYLYYQRNDPTPDENATATSFVVYEGEMLQGKSMRHGRGVTLYNNGTLYEGEWKRNREHGKGTLMTADRRQVIYKGEWERGRMHGQGAYYFRPGELTLFPTATTTANTATTTTTNEIVPRYEGEFKENSRHGNGKYYQADGSTYEGEWRENLMSGRGTFVWPDGSCYIGHWKDGKRHGQGLLRSADTFTYDGMWVKNAMEGRGIAEYPGGQKYEGLWANGRRDGRGTIQFVNGAVYEGRFRDDAIEGQGTMKMTNTVKVSRDDGDAKEGWMIPISFQSDMGRIHQKAGFTVGGD